MIKYLLCSIRISKNSLNNENGGFVIMTSAFFKIDIFSEFLKSPFPFNIPIFSLSSGRINGALDLTIDGADEIDAKKNLIKGGGAALLREKIIAYNSKLFVVIGDETKSVKMLGVHFPLPIEIVPEARLSIMKKLEGYGVSMIIRDGIRKKGPVITDNGNFIMDIKWPPNAKINPVKLESELNAIPGIIENGFFTQKPPRVFLSNSNGIVEEF